MFFKKKILIVIGVLIALLIIAGVSYSNLGFDYNDCRVGSPNRSGCEGNKTRSGENFDLVNIPSDIDDNAGYTVENTTGTDYFIPTGSKAEFESFKNFAYNTSGLDLTVIANGCSASTVTNGLGSCTIVAGAKESSGSCSYPAISSCIYDESNYVVVNYNPLGGSNNPYSDIAYFLNGSKIYGKSIISFGSSTPDPLSSSYWADHHKQGDYQKNSSWQYFYGICDRRVTDRPAGTISATCTDGNWVVNSGGSGDSGGGTGGSGSYVGSTGGY